MAKRKPRARTNGRVTIPDALSKQDRAQAVATALSNLQNQELELTLMQEANGHDDDDLVPGLPATDGEAPTYAFRRKVFTDGQRRLAEKNRDLMPMVEGYLHGVHQQQAQ